MIVYSNRSSVERTSDLLDKVKRNPGRTSDDLLDALISWGVIEAGAGDSLCPAVDEIFPVMEELRRRAVDAGRAFWNAAGMLPSTDGLSGLPEWIDVSIPEGYAYYCLSPRGYGRAAREFWQKEAPATVVVIGLRSIGASLSAVVAAVLEQAGAEVHSYVVRPRGHPFDRQLALGPELTDRWRNARHSPFLIVDEGPGLSGSSFACVARALSALDVAAERIHFLAAHRPDAGSLVSISARDTWRLHQCHPAYPAPHPPGRDLSAGLWRDLFYPPGTPRPQVQPQHEGRKFLCGNRIYRFAGYGDYGKRRLERGLALSAAGFMPRPGGIRDGFLDIAFVPGRPATQSPSATAVHRYLTRLCELFPSRRSLPLSNNEEMAAVNIKESLGTEWMERALAILAATRCAAEHGLTVEIDGRMLPHEWIETADGLMKTDALDHCDDHFFPGNQDIYWDIAASNIELGIDIPPIGESPCAHRAKLLYYAVIYLSYRIGYCTQAAETPAAGSDCAGFHLLVNGYKKRLQKVIGHV